MFLIAFLSVGCHLSLSHFEFLSLVKIKLFELSTYGLLSFGAHWVFIAIWVWSQFWYLSLVTIWFFWVLSLFEFYHNLIFVTVRLFLVFFFTIWVFEFCHDLFKFWDSWGFWVLLLYFFFSFDILSLSLTFFILLHFDFFWFSPFQVFSFFTISVFELS